MPAAIIGKTVTDAPQFLLDIGVSGAPEVNKISKLVFGDIEITYQWYRNITQSWTGAEPIVGAVGTSYTPAAGDQGYYLAVESVATNDQGTDTSRSEWTATAVAVESGNPPSFTTGVTISGTPKVGYTLSSAFEYFSTHPVTISYQWYRDTDGIDNVPSNLPDVAIAGGTSPAYVCIASDETKYMKLKVRLTNQFGYVEAWSSYTTQVAAADAGFPVGAIMLDDAALDARTLSDGAIALSESGKYYVLTKDLSFPGQAFVIGNTNITLDLNGHTVEYNTDNQPITWVGSGRNFSVGLPKFGVHGRNAAYGDTAYGSEWAWPYLGGTGPTGFKLKNGTLTTTATIASGHGMWSRSTNGWSVENCTVIGSSGKDAYGIHGHYLEISIADSVVDCRSLTTYNRHDGPASVRVGRVTINRSLILGGNSAVNCQSGSTVRNSILSQVCFATNGYGMFIYAQSGVIGENNVIFPLNGRGIINDNSGGNHQWRDNAILHWEHQNAEFGAALEPPALRLRGAVNGVVFSGNTTLGVGGTRSGQLTTERHCGAHSIYLTDYGVSGSVPPIIENNTCYAIKYGDTVTDKYRFSGNIHSTSGSANAPADDIIRNNTFYCNDVFVRMSGYDGSPEQSADAPVAGCSFERKTGSQAYAEFMAVVNAKIDSMGLNARVSAAVAERVAEVSAKLASRIDQPDADGHRNAMWALDWSGEGVTTQVYMDFLNTSLGVGVSPATYTVENINNREAYAMRMARTVETQLLYNGSPLADTQVTVTPVGADTFRDDATTATTDASGNVTLKYWESFHTKNGGSSSLSTTNITQSTIEAGGYSKAVDNASMSSPIDLGA